MEPLLIDGSQGEGGGQIVRSSLSLSAITGRPIVLQNIRPRRERPGLQRQHLAAVKAAQTICAATVDGAELGSKKLRFTPGPVTQGAYHFDIGSAGSATLVLQTVLPPLLLAGGPSRVAVVGGTFRTGRLSAHSRTNISVIEAFGVARFEVAEDDGGATITV